MGKTIIAAKRNVNMGNNSSSPIYSAIPPPIKGNIKTGIKLIVSGLPQLDKT